MAVSESGKIYISGTKRGASDLDVEHAITSRLRIKKENIQVRKIIRGKEWFHEIIADQDIIHQLHERKHSLPRHWTLHPVISLQDQETNALSLTLTFWPDVSVSPAPPSPIDEDGLKKFFASLTNTQQPVNFNYDILLSVNVGDGLRTYYDRTNKVFKPLMEMSIQKHPDVCPSQQDLEKISAVVKSSFSKYHIETDTSGFYLI